MWKVFPPFGREMFEARHAENELLQQFFAYGVAGIIMLVGLYASLYRTNPFVAGGVHSRSILIIIIIFIIIRGLAEAEPFDLLLPLWMITLMSSIVEDAARIPRAERFVKIACAAREFARLPCRGVRRYEGPDCRPVRAHRTQWRLAPRGEPRARAAFPARSAGNSFPRRRVAERDVCSGHRIEPCAPAHPFNSHPASQSRAHPLVLRRTAPDRTAIGRGRRAPQLHHAARCARLPLSDGRQPA